MLYTLFHPLVNVLGPILSSIFQVVHDWGIAIVLLTILIRFLLFPLSLRMARQTVRQTMVQAEIKKLREEIGKDSKRLTQETMKLYQKHGIKPLSAFTIALIQMPIFMSLYTLLQTHGATMSSFLVPWVTSFAQTDTWHILPILSVMMTFVTNLIPITADLASVSSFSQRLGMSVIIVPMFLLFLWHAPVALGIYWTTGSLWVLLERTFYRTQVGKKLLKKHIIIEPQAA